MKSWFNVALLVFSVAFTVYGSATLKLMASEGRPGSGFFPFFIGIALIITTGINVIRNFRERKRNSEEEEGIHYGKEIALTILAAIAFVFILKVLGGLLSMILFMFAILLVFNRGKLLQNTLYSVIFPVLMFLLFEWLNAGLPPGVFGIGA